MQRNQLIAGGILILIILLGIGGYLVMGKNLMKSPATTSNNQTSSKEATNGMQSSITDLFSSGDTKQCTFDVGGSSGSSTKGTVYVSGNKAYGSFDMTSGEKTTSMYLIRNDTTFYLWGGGLPSGIKMTMDVNEMATKMSGASNSTFNPNEKVDYKCSPWSLDESKFTPPSNVKFVDAGGVAPKTTGIPSTQTGQDACAAITDPTTKAACENAMMHR